jgi:ubiquinone/menaquinone biosynthesis C-methylase UbiE
MGKKTIDDLIEQQTVLELRIKNLSDHGASSETIGKAYDEFHNFLLENGARGKIAQDFIYKKDLSPIDGLFLKVMGNKSSILEIGLGDGHFLLACANKGNTVSGLDISRVAIGRAEALFNDASVPAKLEIGDASRITFPENSFDFVVSKDLVEHIREADFTAHLQEVKRVLKPNGSYLLWTPSKLLGHTSLGTHLKEYSLSEILDVLTINGFEPAVLSLPVFIAAKSVKKVKGSGFLKLFTSYEKVLASILGFFRINIQKDAIYLIVPPICICAHKTTEESLGGNL